MTKQKDKPRTSHKTDVHRQLALVSPVLRGPDVKQLQLQLNHLADHYEFDWMKIQVDGQYGKRTARQAAFIGWCIGLVAEGRLDVIRHQGRITEEVQRILRNPEKHRSKADKEREDRRRPKMRKVRKQHKEGLADAVQFVLKHVGTKEQPDFSNLGPYPITQCQEWYGLSRVPWCGCLTGFAIENIALDGKKTGTWWPYSGSIRTDAEAGLNGLEDINPANAVLGNIATFFDGGDDHVGLVRDKSTVTMIQTGDGNTSSAHQSSDGGMIEIKDRPFDEVSCVARLNLALL